MNCQREDGGWLHCYDIRDGSEYPGDPETDNVAYMLAHFGNYMKATGDTSWLQEKWPSIQRAIAFLLGKYNPDRKMIWGHEESSLPGCDPVKIRYSLHINCVSVWGLRYAADLAERMHDTSTARQCSHIAEIIFLDSISSSLWDDQEQTFAFGFTEEGQRLTTPVLWMTLMPMWLFGNVFTERRRYVLDYLKRKCYDKDPKIKHTYWVYNYSPILESGRRLETEFSGCGVYIGALPVLIDALVAEGRLKDAQEQLDVIIAYTNHQSRLIPEHLNTLHPGKIGNYSAYPDGYFYVDSGNLLHLSFFLTMILRLAPKMLQKASIEAEQRLLDQGANEHV